MFRVKAQSPNDPDQKVLLELDQLLLSPSSSPSSASYVDTLTNFISEVREEQTSSIMLVRALLQFSNLLFHKFVSFSIFFIFSDICQEKQNCCTAFLKMR